MVVAASTTSYRDAGTMQVDDLGNASGKIEVRPKQGEEEEGRGGKDIGDRLNIGLVD